MLELSGDELVLVLLAVSDAVVVLKILLPGTVRGLLTVANTGAGLGCETKIPLHIALQNYSWKKMVVFPSYKLSLHEIKAFLQWKLWLNKKNILVVYLPSQ